MQNIALSTREVRLLKKHFKHSPIALIRVKSQVILMCNRGIHQEEIAELVVKNVRSVGRYIKAFNNVRMASLFSGHVDNENASKLTREQKKEIRKVLRRKSRKGGVPTRFWDIPKLKDYVKVEFGVVYDSDVSYHFLLRFSNLSFKYPDKLSPRRNGKEIKRRIREIRKEIKPFLKDDGWVVLASDETRLQLEAEIRRAWLLKGKRAIVRTERSDEHQNYLGFLDQKNWICRLFEIKRGNQIETVRVLKKLMLSYTDKKVCVVWDNAKWHKGKLLRKELSRCRKLEKLHLVNFPPYAPEKNPIEHVWQFAKSKTSNIDKGDFQKIKNGFSGIINSRIFKYRI